MAKASQNAPRVQLVGESVAFGQDVLDRLQHVKAHLEIGKASEITLRLDNSSDAITDSKALAEGNIIHLYLGYGVGLDHVCSGEIQKWAPNFPRDGKRVVEIKALDLSHRAMDTDKYQKKAGGAHRNTRDSDIAKQYISKRMGLYPDVDSTSGTVRRFHKKGVSDYQFISRIALLAGYYFWVDYDMAKGRWVGHFKSKGNVYASQDEMYSFMYGNDSSVSLINFKPEFQMRGQTTEVEVVGYDTKTKKTIRQIVREEKTGASSKFVDTDPIDDQIVSGASVVFTALGNRHEVISNKPFRSAKAALAYAKRFMKSRGENFLTGVGNVVGTAELRPMQIHKLGGIGTRFTGKWELTRVVHEVGGDAPYEVEFSSRKVYDPTKTRAGEEYVQTVARQLLKEYYGLKLSD